MIMLIILTCLWTASIISLVWDSLYLQLPPRERIIRVVTNALVLIYITAYGFAVGRAYQIEQDSPKEDAAVIQQAPVDKQLVEKDSTKLLAH